MWVYLQSEPNLYTVGFYDPNGGWHTDSDHSAREQGAARVAFLNGSSADLLSVLRDLRAACTDAYKSGRIAAEPFVAAGNVLAKAEGR